MPPKKTAPPARRLRAHPHLYEINTWVWLESLSAKRGRNLTLAEVPDAEWDALARLGFDIIWLMGMWQRSPESRRVMMMETSNFAGYSQALPGWALADVVGSPYAVRQYVPDPRIGTWDSLDAVREKLRERGMALFLDFVGNHTAPDHPWVREHPEFYVQLPLEECEKNPNTFFPADTKQGGCFIALGKDPYFPSWKDVVQLNYFHPGMRAAMIGELREIARHCDGVRCDMAMLQLTDIFANVWGRFMGGAPRPQKEFWEEAHAAVPGLILLAEAYWGTESRLLDLGFSFVYDKELYDAVRDANVGNVRARLEPDLITTAASRALSRTTTSLAALPQLGMIASQPRELLWARFRACASISRAKSKDIRTGFRSCSAPRPTSHRIRSAPVSFRRFSR